MMNCAVHERSLLYLLCSRISRAVFITDGSIQCDKQRHVRPVYFVHLYIAIALFVLHSYFLLQYFVSLLLRCFSYVSQIILTV